MSTFEEEASNGPKKEKGMFASIISRNKSEDEEGGEETGENGSGQPAYVPLNQQELTSAVQIQFNGSGDFATATATALGGVLTFTNVAGQGGSLDGSEADVGLSIANIKLSKVNSPRKGQPYCFKINLVQPDGSGNNKYIVSLPDSSALREWMIGMQDRIAESIDGLSPEEINQTGGENYPNMLFIPLQTIQPVVDAADFALFIVLLVVFMNTLNTQNFSQDFVTTDGLKGMTGMVQYYKISTVDDYLGWWPVILSALKRWTATRQGWRDPSLNAMSANMQEKECKLVTGCNEIDIEDLNQGAVLLGLPYITQKRRLPLGSSTPPIFNASGSLECPWELAAIATDAQQAEWGVTNETFSCYGKTRSSRYGGHDEYYIPQMQGILNGSLPWDPSNWIGANTVELSHQVTLYFPSTRRFAKVIITVSIDAAGRVNQASRSSPDWDSSDYPNQDEYPVFEVFEPFIWETEPRNTALELVFYVFILKLFIDELLEIWECVCFVDQLLPLQILTASMDLQLHEIMYFHEKASQVYDPRDPNTEKAFEFPDLDDLKEHMNGKVQECEDLRDVLEQKLASLKQDMATMRGKSMKSSEYEKMRSAMADLQLELSAAHKAVNDETHVAEVAAMLQLACMWANDWSFDFPRNYLAQLGANAKIGEDGLDAFKDIEWISVSRAYIKWCDNVGHDHDIKDEGGLTELAGALAFKVTHPFAKDKKGRKKGPENSNVTPQDRHFEKLSPLLDYLDMLHDVLVLHTCLVTARQLKHWAGPKGADMCGTVQTAFQKQIMSYNEIGKRLKAEMEIFPEEIADGFSEPDSMKAETIKIKAKNLLRVVKTGVETAGMLGLFFPGSTLWELQRKSNLAGSYNMSKSFWLSLKSFGRKGTLVADSSMNIYARPSLVMDPDENDGETVNPLDDSTLSPKSPNGAASSRTAAVINETGTPEWRTWVPKGAETLINYDGQFIVPQDQVHLWMKGTTIYPLYLWFSSGVGTYLSDRWNCLEFLQSIFFMMSFHSKIEMLLMEDDLDTERMNVMNGTQEEMPNLALFENYSYVYMKCLTVNAILMWIKVFKYIGVIPQMGVLLTVLSKAGPSVMIFTMVAMVPCVGLALSFHVAFGALVKNYSSPGLSFNSVMRMAVGDFDFDEIYSAGPLMALSLFWLSSLLIVFVLINIFIAIIMQAYDTVLSMNPDAADASNFGSMVMMQLTRILSSFLGLQVESGADESAANVHVLQNSMDRIEDEAYWDIFEGYFDMPDSDDEEDEPKEGDGDDADGDDGATAGGSGGDAAVDGAALRKLTQDVASIKKSQASFQAEVKSQLDELKEMLASALQNQ